MAGVTKLVEAVLILYPYREFMVNASNWGERHKAFETGVHHLRPPFLAATVENRFERVKIGSNLALFIRLNIRKQLGAFMGKEVFDPLLSHLWSQNGPFSRISRT